MTSVHQAAGAGTDGDGSRLEEELQRWLAASAISAEQAEHIRRIEAAKAASAAAEAEAAEAGAAAPGAAGPAPPAPAARVPLVAQALGFLGGALTVIAGIVATSRFWSDFSTPLRLAIVGGAAVLLVLAGFLVRRGVANLDHLGSFLWLLATVTTGVWAGVLAADGLGWTGADVALLVGVVASGVAVGLWAWRPAPLQHVVTLAAVAVLVGGVAGQVQHVDALFIGIGLWGLGVAWAVLAWAGVVRPMSLGYAAGAALAIVAGRILSGDGHQGAGVDVLSIVTALAFLAASVPTRSMVVLWAGVVGVFLSVPFVIAAHFGSSLGTPAALFLAGLALIAVAVVASRLVHDVRAGPARPARVSPRAIAGGLLGIVALVIGATVGFTEIPDVPAFPSLRQAPDSTLTGTVAFVRPGGETSCVYVVPASGAGPERKLLCERNIDEGPIALNWTSAGRLVVQEYGDKGPVAVEVDPADGRVVSRTPASDPGKGPMEKMQSSTGGGFLETDTSSRGKPRLILHSTSGATRTLFSAQGPRDYRFDYAVWSPDARHALLVDSERRLLVIDTASQPATARILATRATSPAWSA